MWHKISPFLTFFLGWPLSIIALFFIGKTFAPHISQVIHEITSVNLFFLVLGTISFAGYYVLRSYVWYLLLQKLGYALPLRESLYLWATSQIKRYIPGNVWSFLGVTLLFSEKKVKKKDIAHALLVEAQLVLLSSLALSLLSLPFIVTSLWPVGDVNTLVIHGSVVLVGLGSLLYFVLPNVLKKSTSPILTKVKSLFPLIDSKNVILLWFAMLVSFILFGFGYYFALSSVIYLDPHHLLIFIGYFVLSLLLGYLSFITPSGLGVREGIITVGLSKFVPLSLAGFAALFGRIVLVLSEVIFVVLMYILSKKQPQVITTVLTLIKKYTYEVVVTFFFFLFSTYFSLISIFRYENYYTGRFDLGNMAQTVWNTYHGRIFELTNPNGTEIVSRLAFHADFILVLFAPFYALWESPNVLLLLQSIIVGAGGLFVYFLANEVLKNKPIALVLSLLYFFNPALERATIYDFHAVTLATTFFLGSFYFLYKKKYGWFLFFAFLAGITKEQVWAVIALLGIYVAYFHKKWRLGISIFLVCTAITYILIWYAIPAASGGEHFALSYYKQTEEGDSPSDLIKAIILEPQRTFTIVTEESRLLYLHKLLLPLGYLPLAAPLYVIFTGPDLVINMLSAKPQLHQIYYQYTANITPFLFIAAIFSCQYILLRWKKSTFILVLYLSTVGLSSAYLYGPLPGARDANLATITDPFPHKKEVNALIKSIPQNASVAASNGLGSHLSHRQYIYTLPQGIEQAEYILITRGDPNNSSSDNFSDIIDRLESSRAYTVIYDDHNVIAFHKRVFAKE